MCVCVGACMSVGMDECYDNAVVHIYFWIDTVSFYTL